MPSGAKQAGGSETSLPAGGQTERTKASPQSDPAFVAVVHHVKQAAAHQKAHAHARSEADAAHAAVQSQSNEIPSRAAAKQTDEIDRQQPNPFNRDAFKTALLKKIDKTAPKSLEDADNFKDNNQLGAVKTDLTAQVGNEKKESQRPLAEKLEQNPNAKGIDPKPFTPLAPLETPALLHIPAAGAAPKPASDQDISLQAGPKAIDQEMADAQLTEEQLRDSNEPQFQNALTEKKEVETESVARPQRYRAEEPGLLRTAQTDAQVLATKDALGMVGARKHAMGAVSTDQVAAKTDEESKRTKIFDDVDKMYQATKSKVEDRLKQLDKEVSDAFDTGASIAQSGFETYVAVHMDAYKDERYGSFGGGALWLKDKVFDLPDAVNVFYEKAHDLYISRMNTLIDQIAAMVESGLKEAKQFITDGKTAIDTYLDGLGTAEKETGAEAATGNPG